MTPAEDARYRAFRALRKGASLSVSIGLLALLAVFVVQPEKLGAVLYVVIGAQLIAFVLLWRATDDLRRTHPFPKMNGKNETQPHKGGLAFATVWGAGLNFTLMAVLLAMVFKTVPPFGQLAGSGLIAILFATSLLLVLGVYIRLLQRPPETTDESGAQ